MICACFANSTRRCNGIKRWLTILPNFYQDCATLCTLDFCLPVWSCSISNNTAFENLGTLYPGQTKALTVVFTAKTGFSLWGWHRGHKFTVKVIGFAASHGGRWLVGQRASLSVAYVTIMPRGWWAA